MKIKINIPEELAEIFEKTVISHNCATYIQKDALLRDGRLHILLADFPIFWDRLEEDLKVITYSKRKLKNCFLDALKALEQHEVDDNLVSYNKALQVVSNI